MPFQLVQTDEFAAQFRKLQADPSLQKRFNAVAKCIRLLSQNPRHTGLNTHKYQSLKGANGEEVFEAYAENRTPGAYRLFWHYGPGRGAITLLSVTPHP